MSGDELLLDVEDLTVAFGDGAPAVSKLSLTVRRGQITALVGESGSGKSVTARALMGLAGAARVSAKRFTMRGRDMMSLGERQWRAIRGADIGLILQDALNSLDPLRPIGREVEEALSVHGWGDRAARRDRVTEVLREAGLDDASERQHARPDELSGGQRQRALIAQALALRPPIIVADEPTTALDAVVQARLLDLLETLRDQGHGILLISHDIATVARLADTIIVLKDGEVIEHGPREDILHSPRADYTRRLIGAIPDPRPATRTAPAISPQSSIEVRGLRKTYPRRFGEGERIALGDVSFKVGRGSTLGVIGESGSGKSTLVWILSGLLEPDQGEIRIFGDPWVPLSHRERRRHRHRVQVVYQDPLSSFDPRHNVARVLDDALFVRGIARNLRPARILELLEQVKLSESLAERSPLELSGGQRQRLAIARALAVGPEILVLDEPVSALDPLIQVQILALLDKLQQEFGLTYVFVSHDLGVVRHVSDQVMVIRDGVIIEQGSTAEVFANPAAAYTRQLIASVPTFGAPTAAERSVHLKARREDS